MSETLSWWLILELMGLVAFPLAFALFRRLPDGGYSFSKPLGILFIGYVFWILGTIGILPNTVRGAAWALTFVAAAAAWTVWRRRSDLAAYLREKWRLVLFIEVLFTGAFFLAVFLRSFVPDISGTEKPMDLLFLNAASRSDGFPPQDPWLSGSSISYYYFGYLMVAMIGKLAVVPTSIGFNLGVAMIAALAVTAAFGIVYNLMAARRSNNPAPAAAAPLLGAPLLFGLVAAAFVAVLGNLEGLLELFAAHGIGPSSFWSWIDIKGLSASNTTTSWYPTEQWFWWRATRILSIQPDGITEFPFFSFLLGDLHPHVMALPFVLLTVGAGVALFLSGERLDLAFWSRRPLVLVALVIMVGSLLFLNTWDMPTFAFLLVVIAFARNRLLASGWRWSLLADTAGFALPLVVLAVLAYLPFYFDFHTQASGLEPVEGGATRLNHELIFWGPFAVLLVPFVLWTLLRDEGWRWLTADRVQLAAVPSALILVVWVIWVLAKGGVGNLSDQLSARGANWLTDLALIALLTTTILALWRELGDSGDEEDRRLVVFALIASGVGALLVLGTEFFFVNDTFGSRMNTVFKLYYQAWLLLAVASALALYRLASAWLSGPRAPWNWRRTLGWAWAGASGLVLAAALVYPLSATLNRTDELGGARGLDGLAFARRNDPDEFAAVRWLADHVVGEAVIAEAVGGSYSAAGRVSAWTGIPTILGWPGHELQWRGSYAPFEGREADVDRIFGGTDEAETKELLAKYNVRYIFVGSVERDKYSPEALAKFKDMFQVAFQQGNVTIYRVVGPVAPEAAP